MNKNLELSFPKSVPLRRQGAGIQSLQSKKKSLDARLRGYDEVLIFFLEGVI